MAKEVPQFVKSSLRSVLLSSQKGIKQTSIEKDYQKLTYSKLDVKKYGYRDLYEFLLALPDVARLEYSVKDGENKVFGVADKGVYMSDHAKKAEGIPNGLKPLPPSEWPRNKGSKERTVVEDKSSLKVTVESEENRKIQPNIRGLYALHIKNLPSNCQEHEVSRIFKQFRSLREVKIETSLRAAFVRFSSYADAVRALSDMDGCILRGAKLTINPATERGSQQNTKVSTNQKEDSNGDGAKKNKNTATAMVNGFVDKKAVVQEVKPGNNKDSTSSSPSKEIKAVAQAESWETDSGLSPKVTAVENKKYFSYDSFTNEGDGKYPIHVSNFPVGTTKETLKQLFSACGDLAMITLKEKFAFVYYTNQEGAATALQKMKRIKLGDRFLTVTPKTPKGKNKKQDGSPVESSTLHRVSSQSSVSSSDSSTPQSPSTSHHISGAACSSGDVSNGHAHTENNNDLTDGGCRGSLESNTGQQKGNCSNITDTSNSTYAFKKEGKLEKSETASCSPKAGTEKGSASLDDKLQAKISPNIKKSAPVHMLLTHVEMCELFKKFKKPLRTLHNIGAQKFDILVTDVVDSCHFWANIDDLVGNYMELVQIGADLQVVQHHDRCMPFKYQLGASLFSEDKKWYRCWCLEVSNLERREAKVFYIDYGNCEWISWNQFTDIHKKFWDLAPQAVPFKLAGLENATDLSPEVLNEGTEYLRALILDKVCKARITQSSDPNEPHIFEVELITKEDAIHVNKQMALTRYVQETRKGPHVAQGPRQNHSIQECHQVPGSQQQVTMVHQQQPATQTPPGTSVNTQNAKVPQTAEHHVRWSVDQEILPSKQAEHSQQLSESSTANSLKNPVQSPQNMQVGQQSLPNQKMEPVEKSLPKTLQLPSYVYQLFDKKEVIDVCLSYVISPDEIYFFLADKKTRESLKGMAWALLNEAKPKAKIYPRVGDIVARVTEKNGEQKMYRVRIKSIPKTAAIGVDKVVVQNVDYGFIETVHLNSLCELPPSLKHLPPHAMQAKMAGIQKKAGLVYYPEWVTSKLVAVKTRRKVLQASVVKRQEGGVLLVELFESEGPSLNVQLLKMDGVQLDESQRPLICFSTSAGSDSSCLSQTASNLPVTTDQNPRWHPQERRPDPHPIDVQSNHSDWEDCLIDVETDRMEATPVTGAHEGLSERQSWDHLYMPPPPEMHSPSSAGSANTVPLGIHPTSAAAGITSHVPLDQHPPSSALASPSSSMSASSIPASIRPPFSGGSLNGLPHDRHTPSSASAPSGSSVPPDVGPPSSVGSESSLPQHTHSPYSSGSGSSDLNSNMSSKGLSSAVQEMSVTETDSRTVLNGGEKILQDKKLDTENELAEQEDSRDWWQAKEELIQKDEELKRILDMPRSEMMKMISLRQEKEKLERKIRMKGLENQILKLQKELKQLELEKEELAGEIS